MTRRGVKLARFGSAFVSGMFVPTFILLPGPTIFSLSFACIIWATWCWLRLHPDPLQSRLPFSSNVRRTLWQR